MELRNIAIIAHVDHGKTTLVDFLLRQSGAFRSNQELTDCVMDSNALERERGITILAKNTSVVWKGVKVNIVDTPGHQDFGGEVERVLRMADGCLLLVDAADGPMPQTRFVLKKALGHGLQPIVVINKLDKPDARPKEVLDEIFYLFIELEASDAQMDFPVVYAIGRAGQSKLKLEDEWSDFGPLFDTILKRVPAPKGDPAAPLQLSVANIDYNDYVGRQAIGRIANGTARPGMNVKLLKRDGSRVSSQIVEVHTFVNLKREKAKEAPAGEIAVIVGCPQVDIGDTIADGDNPVALPFPKIEEPTLSMHFMVNDSPLSGREGQFITSRHVGERLVKETLSDVALRVDQIGPDEWKVSGRGLLHLGILLENMRREGYEVQVSKPEMITKKIDGVLMEPVEMAMVDVPNEYAGSVIQIFGARKGFVEKMDQRHERTHFTFRIPARGLVGLQSRLLSATRGQAVVHTSFEGYEEWKGDIPDRQAGVLIAQEDGEATSYAMDGLQSRGSFFTPVGTKVYMGMVVGEHCKERDLVVNVARKKRLTNMRAASADATVVLAQPRIFALEEALEYINDDELVEITPKSIRMRKKILDENKRKRSSMREMAEAEAENE
jgi:GTP-binding protein